MNPLTVTLYTREGCTLCIEAHYLLKWLADSYPIEIQLIDITKDPELELRYALEVPVIEANGEVLGVSLIEEGPIRAYLDSYFSKVG